MVNKKYLLVAKNLADRNMKRLDTTRSEKEQERDELFYWVMSRVEWSIQGCWPAKASHSVTIEEMPLEYTFEQRVLLAHGNVSQYLSQYVNREEFYSIMQEVAEIISKMGNMEKDGYSYYARCYTPDGHAKLTVTLTTKT